MTNAVAEQVEQADSADSVETMLENFDLGDDVAADEMPGSAETIGAETNGESGETILAAEEMVPAAEETISVADTAATDITAADPHAAELAALRQQLDHATSRLSEIQYADRQICEQAARVRQLADDVQNCESSAKEAKADLTAAKERYESAVRELRSMVDDRSKGQGRLPLVATAETPAKNTETPAFVECVIDGNTQIPDAQSPTSTPAAPAPPAPPAADEHAASPISVLSAKQMLALVGQDVMTAAKDRDEPFGMAKGEMEILEAAEIATIGDLEKRMREDAWWHEKLPKFGEKKVAKLIESLRVWRGKFPMPEGVS